MHGFTHTSWAQFATECNLSLCRILCFAMKDFYEVLDVEKTASDSEIKVAYRKQALLWHPGETQGAQMCCDLIELPQLHAADKHQGRDTLPEAEQRFKEVVNAW